MNRVILMLAIFLLSFSAYIPAEDTPEKVSEEVTADAGILDRIDSAREERQRRRAERARQREKYHQEMSQYRWGQVEGEEDQ